MTIGQIGAFVQAAIDQLVATKKAADAAVATPPAV